MYIQVKIRSFGMPSSYDLLDLDLTGTTSCGSFNLRRTARAVTRFYDLAFQDCGIRSTQFTILIGIAQTQPTSIGALSDLLILDRTTLTRSLRILKKDGLLAISDRSTMRQRFLTLTPEGQQMLARSLPAWREAHARFVQALGSDYWTNLRKELQRLVHVVTDLEKQGDASGKKQGAS
jgi:DNA-binding MarR family transcriptional regulator